MLPKFSKFYCRKKKEASDTSKQHGENRSKQNNKEKGESTRDKAKALTYREWKEQQQKKNCEEKPQKYGGKPFKERKYVDYEEKPPNRYHNALPRRPMYTRDFEKKSPPQTTKSPTYFSGSDRLHQVARKRTYSNNSDSISSADVKKFKQYEQVSPEPGEIT